MFKEGVKPKRIISVSDVEKNPSKIYDFVGDEFTYADSFGEEWKSFSRVQSDALLKIPTSRRRLENLLGFPVEWLKEMSILEIGSGAGRFSKILADYAKELTTVDLSEAIFVNEAIGKPNVTFVRTDLNENIFNKKFDLIFCRGVLQHTPNPDKSIKNLFQYGLEGSIIIFDIYAKTSLYSRLRDWKYFYRLILKPFPNKFIQKIVGKYGEKLFHIHSFFNRLVRKFFLLRLLVRILRPLYPKLDVDLLYPTFSKKQKLDVYLSILLDVFTSKYDNPRDFNEVVNNLASIGQYPYSYNEARCMFRVKKRNHKPFTPNIGKDGVFES